MLTDLVQIRRLGEKAVDDNSKFRRYLKDHRHDDKRLRRIASDIEEQIDCTKCANCCRTATTELNSRDVERLAKYLGMTVKRFLADYTEQNADENELILKRNVNGCIFLEGNLCSVYEERPGACVHYPHLVRSPGSLASRMWSIVERAPYCPIVYHTLEAWKDHLGFRRAKN